MEQGRVERRRGRRVKLEAPLLVRRMAQAKAGSFEEEVTQDISLAGVYFETEGESGYAINDAVMTSVSVPEPKRREFPFTRIAGKGRVVRVKDVPQAAATGRKKVGVALEFGADITALTAIPTRG